MPDEYTDQKLEEFFRTHDALDQCSFLLEQAFRQKAAEGLCVEENRIKGCQVAIWCRRRAVGECEVYSDSLLVNGVLSLITGLSSGKAPAKQSEVRFLSMISEDVIAPEIKEKGLKFVARCFQNSDFEQ